MALRATDMHQRTRFMFKLPWRNFVEGELARAFLIIAWILTPRQIPKEEIRNQRRNDHFLSSGRILCSKACRVSNYGPSYASKYRCTWIFSFSAIFDSCCASRFFPHKFVNCLSSLPDHVLKESNLGSLCLILLGFIDGKSK